MTNPDKQTLLRMRAVDISTGIHNDILTGNYRLAKMSLKALNLILKQAYQEAEEIKNAIQ